MEPVRWQEIKLGQSAKRWKWGAQTWGVAKAKVIKLERDNRMVNDTGSEITS